jgi:hypothetical protein
MKRFLMLVAVATVAGAMYVAAAPGSQQAAGPTAKQFAALKKQVASLSTKLKALKTDEGKVKTLAVDADGFIAGCFLKAGVVPVNQFGDPAGTQGFLYGTPGSPPTASSVRTAVDVDASTTPGAFIQAVDSSCVNSSGAATHSGSGHLLVRAEHAR